MGESTAQRPTPSLHGSYFPSSQLSGASQFSRTLRLGPARYSQSQFLRNIPRQKTNIRNSSPKPDHDRLRESREEDKLVFLQPQGETKFLTNSYRLISMAKGSVAKNGCGLAKLHLEVSCAHGLTALIQSTVRLTCPGPELHCSFHTQVH